MALIATGETGCAAAGSLCADANAECNTDTCELQQGEGACDGSEDCEGALVCIDPLSNGTGTCMALIATGETGCAAAGTLCADSNAECNADSCELQLSEGMCDGAEDCEGILVCDATSSNTCLFPQGGGACDIDAECVGELVCDDPLNDGTGTCKKRIPTGDTGCAAANTLCADAKATCTDDRCQYPVGEGPCDTANQATVCESSVCDTGSNLCVECLTDLDCSSGSTCESQICTQCGDGTREGSETCDEGSQNGDWPATCSHSCHFNLGQSCTVSTQCNEGAVCSLSSVCDLDSDGDTIGDIDDPDDDNDGILDVVEGQGAGALVDPSADTNGDGRPDYLDPTAPGFIDENSDGVDDRHDFDGDGVPNHLDLDSDNDGISDTTEGGGLDVDADGLLDSCQDTNTNGLCDSVDEGLDGTALPVPNTDGALFDDFLDLDADDDGVTDAQEASESDADGDGVPDTYDGTDADSDGVDDAGLFAQPRDSNGDGTPDFLETDSDDDGLVDALEAHDLGGAKGDAPDGIADTAPSGADSDEDGLDDAFDPDCVSAADCDGVVGTIAPLPDRDGDGRPDYMDVDADGDGITDAEEQLDSADPDEDGIPNYLDFDSDGDGLFDIEEGHDTDGDGDVDLAPAIASTEDSDDDGLDDAFDPDCAVASDCVDDLIGVPAALVDTDKDGMPNFVDADDDNDGLFTALEDPDESGDVHDDDTDEDGTPNFLDPDDDGDGILTSDEGSDPNGDGDPEDAVHDVDPSIPDYLNPDSAVLDSDGDSIPDSVECPDGKSPDTDKDGKADCFDEDDDGDGIPTKEERQNGDVDTDGDGIPNHLDADDDNDGVPTSTEGATEDTDGDGTPDYLDTDDDGDGVPTQDELDPEDSDGDGTPDYLDTDDDGDGVETADELDPEDTDGDGTPDYLDTDDDGDSVPTSEELDRGDTDGDGTPDYLDTDDDGDGILTEDELEDTDGNGVPEYLELGKADDNASLLGGGFSCSMSSGTPDGRLPILLLFGLGALTLGRRRKSGVAISRLSVK